MSASEFRIPAPLIARLGAFVCAGAFVFWFAGGPPVLRHDWPSPYASVISMSGALSGWDPSGIGMPNGYPSSFIAAFVQYALLNVLGPYAGTFLWQLTIAAVCAFGAKSCVRVFTASATAQIAGAALALFNPWVYTQLVAGHAFMLLAYGGTFWLVREALLPTTNDLRLIVCGLLIAPQIQFFVLDWPLAAFLVIRDRRPRALAAWILLTLPIAIGVIATRSALLGTPQTLGWERSQSVELARAALLLGYFAKYAKFEGLALAGTAIVLCCAAAGSAAIFAAQPRRWYIPAFTALALILATALNGPWEAPAAWVFAHIPEAGLFRELYDFLGFAAVGYVLLCAILASRMPYAGAVWLVGSVLLFTAWVSRPPSAFWVAAQHVPALTVVQSPNTRFALIPALQPIQWHGRGSGVDPDAYTRAPNVTPVNEFVPSYPVSAAFGHFLIDGDRRYLAALSVADIYVRDSFRSDFAALRYQWPFQDRRSVYKLRGHAGPPQIPLSYLPEMTTSDLPDIGSLETNIGAGNMLFSDAAQVRGRDVPADWSTLPSIVPVHAPNTFVDASKGWVDARLAFVERPELAQPFGGALTTNPNARLPVDPAYGALIWVDGSLSNDRGRRITRSTNGYIWTAIPKDTAFLRCEGTCVVASQGNPPHVPANPPAHPAGALAFTPLTSWLAVSVLPPERVRMLRYNVTYDTHWTALLGYRALPHLRVDGIVNGWIVPEHTTSERVIVIETGAAATCAAELLCIVGIIVLVLLDLREKSGVSGLHRDAAGIVDAV